MDHIFRGKLGYHRAIHWHVQFTCRHDIVLASGIIRIEADRVRVADKTDIAPAKLAIRSRQVIVETELLRHDVNNQRLFAWRKLIHPLCPERNSKPEEEHRFDQHNGKFQMRRYRAAHPGMISGWLPPFPEPNQHENNKRGPADKQRAHEPVTKLDDMVDLITMGGSIRRLPEEFIDQREAIHICLNLPR